MHKTKSGKMAKKGLWYNIQQKKKRGMAIAKSMSGRTEVKNGGCMQIKGFGKARRPKKK